MLWPSVLILTTLGPKYACSQNGDLLDIQNSDAVPLLFVPPLPDHKPTTHWVINTASCIIQSNAPDYGQNCCPKHVELIWIINKPLLLHLVGFLLYRRYFLFSLNKEDGEWLVLFITLLRSESVSDVSKYVDIWSTKVICNLNILLCTYAKSWSVKWQVYEEICFCAYCTLCVTINVRLLLSLLLTYLFAYYIEQSLSWEANRF